MVAIPFFGNAVDVGGGPASGAKLQSWVQSTTTPLPLYSDFGLSVPATNPVIADADGRLRFYADSTKDYTWRITTSDGATVLWEADVSGGVIIAVTVANGDFLLDLECTYTTRTSLQAAAVPVYAQRVKTMGRTSLFDNGGAEHKRLSVAPSPAKAWHTQSADGAWWEIDTRYWTPEMLGAKGDGSTSSAGGTGTDDTDALLVLSEAVQTASLKIKQIDFRKDAVYWVFETGRAFTQLFNLFDVNDTVWNGNGAVISARTSSNLDVQNFFVLTRCSRNTFNWIRMNQPNLAKSAAYGCNYMQLIDGSGSNTINLTTGAGTRGVSITRNLGSTEARCQNNRINIIASSTYYPLSLQGDGDGTIASVYSLDAGRSLIAYNAHNWDVRIYSTNNNSNQDVVIGGAAGQWSNALNYRHTLGWKVYYYNRNSSAFTATSPIVFGNSSSDASGDYQHRCEGEITLDVNTNGGAWSCIISHGSNIWLVPGVSYQAGEPAAGHKCRIVVKGKIDGDVNGSGNAFELGNSASGFGANSDLEFVFQDLHAPDLTQELRLGRCVRFVARNFRAAGVARVLESSFSATNFVMDGASQMSGVTVGLNLGTDTVINRLSAGRVGANANELLQIADLATSGYPGEEATATQAPVSINNNTQTNITSLTINGAGTFDINAVAEYVPAATTSFTRLFASVGDTSGSIVTTYGRKNDRPSSSGGTVTGGSSEITLPIGPFRVTQLVTTTYYLVGYCLFSVSTMTVGGMIRAVRVK